MAPFDLQNLLSANPEAKDLSMRLAGLLNEYTKDPVNALNALLFVAAVIAARFNVSADIVLNVLTKNLMDVGQKAEA